MSNGRQSVVPFRISNIMIRKVCFTFAAVVGLLAVVPAAQACPMCQLANENGSNPQAVAVAKARPRAYQYSILFMLAMPATLTTAFGLAFYRLHKRQEAENAAVEAADCAIELLPEATPA